MKNDINLSNATYIAIGAYIIVTFVTFPETIYWRSIHAVISDFFSVLILVFSFLTYFRRSLFLGGVIAIFSLNISLMGLLHFGNQLIFDTSKLTFLLGLVIISFFVIGFVPLFKNALINKKIFVKPKIVISFIILFTLTFQMVMYQIF